MNPTPITIALSTEDLVNVLSCISMTRLTISKDQPQDRDLNTEFDLYELEARLASYVGATPMGPLELAALEDA